MVLVRLLSLLIFVLVIGNAGEAVDPPLLFQFGDSLSDTGNALAAFHNATEYKHLWSLPYGMTFFHHPCGRESDGRLLVDFLAAELGLPFLEPFLSNASYRHGADFAVSGAPALSLNFLKLHNVTSKLTFDLDAQRQWFLEFQKKSQAGGDRFPDPLLFSKALYIVGEIGGNDYWYLYGSGLDFRKIRNFVPLVVESIAKHVRELYKAGARRFLVVNIGLQGCTPGMLAEGRPSDTRDKYGCISGFNDINFQHNRLLKSTVDALRLELADATISFGDFTGVYKDVLENPKAYGILNPYVACCGRYTNSAETTVECGETKIVNGEKISGSPCNDPSAYIYWNKQHFTDYFNSILASEFLTSGKYVDPPLRRAGTASS